MKVEKYGLLNPAKTDIIDDRYTDSTKFFELAGGGGTTTPGHDDFIAANWVLYVQTVYGVHEKQGPQFIDLDALTYGYDSIPWRQEELDNETAEEAKAPQLESINLDFLSGPFAYATKDEAVAEVNERIDPDLYPGINWTCRQIVKNLVQLNTFRRLTLEEHKNVVDAVVPPTVNDDLSQGFTVDSLWRDDLAGKDYKLIDSTIGEAVWILVLS